MLITQESRFVRRMLFWMRIRARGVYSAVYTWRLARGYLEEGSLWNGEHTGPHERKPAVCPCRHLWRTKVLSEVAADRVAFVHVLHPGAAIVARSRGRGTGDQLWKAALLLFCRLECITLLSSRVARTRCSCKARIISRSPWLRESVTVVPMKILLSMLVTAEFCSHLFRW